STQSRLSRGRLKPTNIFHHLDGRYQNIDRGYLGRLLQLTLLAPDIVQGILNGKCPERIGLPVLMSPLPSPWQDQRANLGLG
ncbi:MAG: hypothetical protein O9272_06515, partial [Brevundimonas sp.]|nr:hypothetical protein [Brevundimonas sp.]